MIRNGITVLHLGPGNKKTKNKKQKKNKKKTQDL